VLSDCGISAAGIVDPDAIPNSERLNPAAPSRVTAAALVVRFFLEACLTRRMVASSLLVNALGVASLRSAKGARKYLPPCHKMKWNLGKRAESGRLRTVLSSLAVLSAAFEAPVAETVFRRSDVPPRCGPAQP
jgi:hypothetical protein